MKSDLSKKINLIVFFIISLLVATLIVKNLKIEFLLNTILITFSLYLFFVTLSDFISKKYKNLSQNIAHFGFSLLIISILFNNIFTTEIITNLKVGEKFESENYKIEFENLYQKDKKNFKSIIGKFKIENSQGDIEIMKPELRIYNQPNISTSEADIRTNLLSDKFITMNIVQNQEYFNIRYQTKPLMMWIWLSVLIITISGFVSFFKKKYEN